MIAELLQLQSQIAIRGQSVGRLIRDGRHWAYMSLPFPAVAPWVSFIGEAYISVSIGRSQDGSIVSVQVPTQIFDSGTDMDVRVWVSGQNMRHEKEVEKSTDMHLREKAIEDLRIMKDLIAKYPEEAAEIRGE